MRYCRWGEVSGKHIELRVGDIVDFDFLAGVFKVSIHARRQQDVLLRPCTSCQALSASVSNLSL